MARFPKPEDEDFLFFRIFKKRMADAKKRNIKWNLSFKDFLILSKKNCFFCGAEPRNKFSKSMKVAKLKVEDKFQGIDRIDPKLGYSKTNVVPCCWMCNRIKSNITAMELLCHVQKMLPKLTTLVIKNVRIGNGKKDMATLSALEEEITRLFFAK